MISAAQQPSAHIIRQSGATAVITPYDTPLPEGVLSVDPSAVLKNNMALYFEEQWGIRSPSALRGPRKPPRVCIQRRRDHRPAHRRMDDHRGEGKFYLRRGHQGARLSSDAPYFGFVALMIHFSVYGKVLVYPKDRSAATTMETCQKHGVTHIFNVPLFGTASTRASGARRR